MSKLIAIHEIQTTDAKKNKATIAPGTPFDAADYNIGSDEQDRLIEMGAVKKATAKEVAEAKAMLGANAGIEKKKADEGKDDGVDLSKLTKAELVAHAKKTYGLELKETDPKESLISEIEKAAN